MTLVVALIGEEETLEHLQRHSFRLHQEQYLFYLSAFLLSVVWEKGQVVYVQNGRSPFL